MIKEGVIKMALLEVKRLTKRFGGLVAVNELSFQIEKGEILGLIGPNGAGKTTVFNLITGVLKPDKGNIIFEGEDITKSKPYEICKKGIARTHQLCKPFLNQTVLQNALVGRFFGRSDNKVSMEEAVAEITPLLKFLNLYEKKNELVRNLHTFDRKNVELLRALATKPKLLLLDEPAAGLNPKELSVFMEMVKEINRMGITICIVEHVMRVITGLCDRVVVMHYGEKIAEGSPEKVAKDVNVIKAYLGEAI
jgi:branched-chain amino acid transport system ATP-binding protein